MIYQTSDDTFLPFEKKIFFIHRNNYEVKYVNADRLPYWNDFCQRWVTQGIPVVKDLSLTPEQQGRLDELQGTSVNETDAALYVEFGAIPGRDDDETLHPFFAAKEGSVEASDGTAAMELEFAKRALLAKLPAIRYARETGGVTLDDGTFAFTTREAQAQISSALITLQQSGRPSVVWKATTGWTEVTEAEFLPFASAVSNFVQNCFLTEKQVEDEILQATQIADWNVEQMFEQKLASL